MNTYLPTPTDSELQRLHDQLAADGIPPSPVEFARKVLARWGVVVTWLPQEHNPNPQQLTFSIPMTATNPCQPAEQQARQDRLELAYIESGRTNGLYTGLFTVVDDNQSEEIAAAS